MTTPSAMLKFDSIKKACLGLCHNKGYKTEISEFKVQPSNRLGSFQKNLYLSANPERKVNQEYYIYDGLAMVGSIGGSLGLFIGFSFFEVMCLVLDFLSEKYQSRRSLGCRSCNCTPNFWGGTLLTQKIFDARNFNAGILTPGLLSLDGI